MGEFRAYAIGVAAFGVVTHVALIIAAFGVISLLADIDVIQEPDAGVLLGPGMITAAVAVTCGLWIMIALRVPRQDIRVSMGACLGVGFAAYFAYVLTGAVFYTFGTGQLFSFAIFMAAQLVSPFAVVAGLVAWLLTLIYLALVVRKAHGSAAPHWPWEKDDE